MEYRSNQEMEAAMLKLAEDFPHIANTFVLGQSVSGQPLMGIRLGVQPKTLLKPMVRYIGNIHGNEAMGREILLQLAQHMLHSYGLDDRVTLLIDTTDISILPSLNPDGFDRATELKECQGRGYKFGADNENKVDLNKDFPTWRDKERWNTDLDYDVFEGRQPETEAVMNWSANLPFVLSANFQDGAVVVTYPFDHYRGLTITGRSQAGPHTTPDQDIFHHLASTYVQHHTTMANQTRCFRKAKDGFANGADWYSRNQGKALEGTLRDFSYMFTSNMELVVSVACCKYNTRPRFHITREWENNRESLLAYMEQVHRGVKGLVLYNNQPVRGADIVVWDPDNKVRRWNVTSQVGGEYFRILMPRQQHYRIQAVLDDCQNSGNIFYSERPKVLVTKKRPLREMHLILNPRGIDCISGQQNQDTTSVRRTTPSQNTEQINERVDETTEETDTIILHTESENSIHKEEREEPRSREQGRQQVQSFDDNDASEEVTDNVDAELLETTQSFFWLDQLATVPPEDFLSNDHEFDIDSLDFDAAA